MASSLLSELLLVILQNYWLIHQETGIQYFHGAVIYYVTCRIMRWIWKLNYATVFSALSTLLGPVHTNSLRRWAALSDSPSTWLRDDAVTRREVCGDRKTTVYYISHGFLCIVTNVTFIPLTIIRAVLLICHPLYNKHLQVFSSG